MLSSKQGDNFTSKFEINKTEQLESANIGNLTTCSCGRNAFGKMEENIVCAKV